MSEQSTESGPSWLERVVLTLAGEPGDRESLLDTLRDAQKRDIFDADALSIIEGALQVSDMQVREVMIPRSQVVVVRIDDPAEDFLATVIESRHSRFPVISDDFDDIRGILLAKDLLPLALRSDNESFRIKDVMRPVTRVPESMRLNMLLQEFRSTRNHMAVVFDEYGGAAGVATIEDVLEQIVGDIEDEHDFDTDGHIKPLGNHCFTINALTPIDEFNEHFNTEFSDDDFDTIGGIVINRFGRVPKRDESITIDTLHFKVLNSDNRRVKLLQLNTSPGSSAG